MKKIFTSIFLLFTSYNLSVAQCTPNAYTGNHGFILPDSTSFPHTQPNIPFNANIQIQVAADTTGLFSSPPLVPTPILGTYVFNYIKIDSVNTKPKLPDGVILQYSCNPSDCKFLGGSTGCIDVNVSAMTSVGVYRIYVYAMAKGTFTPSAFPIPVPNITVAQVVDRYKIIVDPTGTFIGEFEGDEYQFHFLEVQQNNFDANTKLKFYSPNNQSSKIIITDIQGKIINSEITTIQKGINTKSIDLTSVANGVYFITIQNNNSNYNKKIVVQHQ
jgi:hypothetical protein